VEIVTVHHHLAVLDENGIIIFVNKAWRQFADANGLVWDDYGVGRSYLEVCEVAEGDNAIEARAALKGIHGIMTNQQEEYSLEYPCHSPAEQRWFFMYVFRYEDNCKVHIVVIHMNITGQMLAEEKLQNSHDKLQLSVEERTANFVMTTEQMKREIRKQKK
jgi:PAS domain-containing protein